MGLGNCKIVAPLIILSYLCANFSAAIDTITASQSIKDPQTIVSAGNTFTLGFFSLVNSTNRYVGVWYSNNSATKPVWVANRSKPINDSSGMLKISEDGNLVVLNSQKVILWSSNVSSIGVGNITARLKDDGNILLQASPNGNIVWQSFQQPSDTFLPGMKFISNATTGEKTLLTSWISPSDPSTGSFSAGLNPFYIPEFFIWNNNDLIWRSGPWNGLIFIGVSGATYPNYSNGYNPLTHYVLSSEGKYSRYDRDYGKEDWEIKWEAINNDCDVYGKCGPFGSCDSQKSPICRCLRGFDPKNADEWDRGNWTSGCTRRTLLQCDSEQNGNEMGKGDGFLKMEMMKLPKNAEFQSSPLSEQECKDECLSNCSCVAYSYYNGFGCMAWTGDLMDIQKFSAEGADLNIRLAYSELDNKRNSKGNMKVIISIPVIVGPITISFCLFFSWRWMSNRKERKERREDGLYSKRNTTQATFLDQNMLEANTNQVKLQELPVFSLLELATAADNFAASNKLGQGGFGQVSRGKLPEGQEIAIKRLSRSSGQGLEEFKNEVIVISKLQHRNLVRLLGCCVDGEEKMLVYEYMPNKSLDSFLFGSSYCPFGPVTVSEFYPVRKEQLDWKKRINIVEGICRGLLYLHRDSRLRIIHRDLKASNILLDQQLNPKISDFGMARIFDGNEDQAKTTRVMGTFGYMSPEYVMEGRFSEKSDVFSFGVLLLEIVSGRRNNSFNGSEQALSLIGFAWKLWNKGNITALLDPAIYNPSLKVEIFRCVQVGLLCVQEFAKDRPNMSTVIAMLSSEIVDLPSPKNPAFAERQIGLDAETFTQSQNVRFSINHVTVSDITGR